MEQFSWFVPSNQDHDQWELRKLLQSLCIHEGAEREKNGGWNEDFSEYAKARFGQEPVSNIEEYVEKLRERRAKEQNDGWRIQAPRRRWIRRSEPLRRGGTSYELHGADTAQRADRRTVP